MIIYKKVLKTSLSFLFIGVFTILSAGAASIKGKFLNAKEFKKVYLYQSLASEYYKIDSVNLPGSGEFKFKNNKLPRGYYKVGVSETQSVLFVLGNEDITIQADIKNLPASVKISNSKENECLNAFNKFNEEYNQQLARLDQLAQPILAEKYSNPEKFNTEIKKLQIKLDSLNKGRIDYLLKLSDQNKDLFVGKMAKFIALSDTTSKENFFTNTDFSDKELARGEILSSKVVMYLQRFVTPQLEAWQTEGEEVLNKFPKGSLNREAAYIALVKVFAPHDPDFSKKLAAAYAKEYSQSAVANNMLASLPKGAPGVGDIAPDIKLTDPSGKMVSLSSLRGKVVLIDFWASWCGPCRRENPNVVKAYQKFKDKGFTIFSVSLDNEKEKWLQAIQKDNLTWDSHVSDLKGWQSSAAQLYRVRGIPATFLVGKDGKVIATNLRGESLDEKLEELCR